MSLITIKTPEEMKKYLKEGTDSVYEFKIMGIFVDVKFKFNLFDTRSKRIKEEDKEGGLVVIKARSIKADSIVVDRIESDKIKANAITATYLFVKKIKARVVECMNIESEYIKSTFINTTVLDAKKIKTDYVDTCELRNCRKMKAKKVSLLSMDGGKLRAAQVSINNNIDADILPKTRKWYNFLLWRDGEKGKAEPKGEKESEIKGKEQTTKKKRD